MSRGKQRRRREGGRPVPAEAGEFAHVASYFSSRGTSRVGGRTHNGYPITGNMTAWELTRHLRPSVRDRVLDRTR